MCPNRYTMLVFSVPQKSVDDLRNSFVSCIWSLEGGTLSFPLHKIAETPINNKDDSINEILGGSLIQLKTATYE